MKENVVAQTSGNLRDHDDTEQALSEKKRKEMKRRRSAISE